MKRAAFVRMAILELAAACFLSAARTAGSAPAGDNSDPGLRVTSRISGEKRRFKIGERVPLEVVLTNRTDHELKFRYLGGWSYYNGKSLEVTRDGKPVKVHETILLGAVPVLFQAVPAGKTVAVPHVGLWLGKPDQAHQIDPYLQEPVPGTYRVQMYHPNAPGSVKLPDSLEFEVVAD